MATAHLKGGATLTWTPSGGSSATVHKLAVPLLRNPAWGFHFARPRQRWEAWSADLSEREVFALGAAVDEIAALVRFENEPEQLRAMLRAGLEDNVIVTYRPDGIIGTAYPLMVVAVDGGPDAIEMQPERSTRFAMGEWEVSVLFRRVDGGTLAGLLS